MNDELPREKLARRGAAALNDVELAALVLRTGVRGASAVQVAEAVLRDNPEGFGSDFRRLSRTRGVGPARAASLAAAAEMVRRGKPDLRPVIDGARAVAAAVPVDIRGARKEHFMALCLNSRRQLIRLEIISVGTLSASLVHPREFFGPALVHAAAAIVAVHNHPSADVQPSAEDRDVTRRLQRAGELLGIPLADHVIVGEDRYFSFREQGLL